jgi:hypothetical protein
VISHDLAVPQYLLAGMSINRWRRMVVDELQLTIDDVEVEVGCATGLDFPFLEQRRTSIRSGRNVLMDRIRNADIRRRTRKRRAAAGLLFHA